MTRDEAIAVLKIAVLKSASVNFGSRGGRTAYVEALEMAIKALRAQDVPDTNVGDMIYRQDAIDIVVFECGEWTGLAKEISKQLSQLPSAQADAVTASLEELIDDYGEDGFFIVDGVNYQANELLNELKTNSSVGEKFRKQITKTIVQYFMKFGG